MANNSILMCSPTSITSICMTHFEAALRLLVSRSTSRQEPSHTRKGKLLDPLNRWGKQHGVREWNKDAKRRIGSRKGIGLAVEAATKSKPPPESIWKCTYECASTHPGKLVHTLEAYHGQWNPECGTLRHLTSLDPPRYASDQSQIVLVHVTTLKVFILKGRI